MKPTVNYQNLYLFNLECTNLYADFQKWYA